MADVNRGNRPLSPHLQVYRPQFTSITSILTRITGNALVGFAVLFAWWLGAAAFWPAHFTFVDWLLRSWLGDLVLLAALWSMWYHYLAGLRHMYWDSGRGLEINQAWILALVLVIGSFVLTAISVLLVGGGFG